VVADEGEDGDDEEEEEEREEFSRRMLLQEVCIGNRRTQKRKSTYMNADFGGVGGGGTDERPQAMIAILVMI
jgi:hypothetical protein